MTDIFEKNKDEKYNKKMRYIFYVNIIIENYSLIINNIA